MRPLPRRLCTALHGLALLFAAGASASSVPEPLFTTDPGGFTQWVEQGQFRPLLEIHLTQYAVDADWATEWAAGRYERSGLLAGYGSVSARALHTRLDLALNLAASERLQLRYDQRRWADTRFDLREERFDLLWWATPGVGLLASGWPTPHKQHAALGFGFALGRAPGNSRLVVLARDDRYVFNQKTDSEVRFTRKPMRLLVDGFTSGEAWQAYASLNLGTAYAAEGHTGQGAGESASGRLQYGDAGALWRRGPVHATLTGRFASQNRAESARGTRALSLERDWWRVDSTLECAPGAWGGALLVGYAQQRDRFFEAASAAGRYRAGTALLGTEAIYRGWRGAELRLGYVGSVYDMERDSRALGPGPSPLGIASDESYADKAHLVGRYRVHPALTLEALLSKEVSRGGFGGFSVRAFGQL